MADANVSRLGQIQGAGDAMALFLKLFAGETLTAMARNVILRDKHVVRPIKGGKSAQFPATWKIGHEYHTPGKELLGLTMEHNEVVINVDSRLVSHAFLDEIDELMAPNGSLLRTEYANQIGRSLAEAYDANVCRTLLLAARGPALFSGDVGGSTIVNAAVSSDGKAIADAIYAAMQTLEEADVPVNPADTFVAVKPAQFYLLANNLTVNDTTIGGVGRYAETPSPKVGGLTVSRSNNLVFGKDESADANILSKYRGDWTNSRALVWNRYAAGTVQLKDVTIKMNPDGRRLGTLLVGSYVVGHGVLRSKCAVEIAVA